MPERGRGYAVNEGRAHGWAPAVRAFVEHLKTPDKGSGRPYATRYSASLVGRRAPVPARGRHLPLSGRRRTAPARASCASSTSAIRSPSSSSRRAAGPRPARSASSTSLPTSLHERMPLAIGSAAEVELFDAVRREGMTRALLAAALLLTLGAAPRPAPTPAPRPAVEEDEERAERPVRFAEPAPEMKKLSALVGVWAAHRGLERAGPLQAGTRTRACRARAARAR